MKFRLIIAVILLAPWLASLAQAPTRVQVRPRFMPVGPVVTNQVFLSPNKRYQLFVEDNPNAISWNMDDPMVATMSRRDRNPVKLWTVNFKTQPLRGWLTPDVLVSDDGSFAVIPHFQFQPILLKDGVSLQLPKLFTKQDGHVEHGETIVELDRHNNEPLICIWSRSAEKWGAFSVVSEKVVSTTPELIARWNEITRQHIIERFQRAQADAVRKKIGAVSQKLSELTETAIPSSRPGDLRDVYFEFLALLHNPADRFWFENLLRSDHSNPIRPPSMNFVSRRLPGMRYFVMGEAYSYVEQTPLRKFGDAHLALHERKTTNKYSYSRDTQKTFYLGQVAGLVRLPAPVVNRGGMIHIHLVPQDRVAKNWINDTIDSIDAPLEMVTGGQYDLTDEISFYFPTVPPGQYMLKAIWDKRRPFTDRERGGPGDYESKWIGPIDVAAGGSVTNLSFACDTVVAGADQYYAADRLALRQWKETGELTLLSRAYQPDRREVFSAPASHWIVRTNFVEPGLTIDLTRIALYAPLAATNSKPATLSVLWRSSTPVDLSQAPPVELRLVDRHGCEYFTYESDLQGLGKGVIHFPVFPRSEETWRLRGYAPRDELELVFDYTITNHTRIDPIPLTPQTLPLDFLFFLDFGTLQLRVDRVVRANTVWMESSCLENGIPSSDWFVPGLKFSDGDGNIVEFEEGCRQKTALRVFGVIQHRKKSISAPFEFTVNLASLPSK